MELESLVRKNVLNIEPYEPGKPIEEVQRELGLHRIVKLASNENPLGPSPRALRAIKKAAREINRYPDSGCFLLKRRLAQRLGLNENNLIFGNGSNEIIELVVRTFLNEDEEVLVGEPAFLIFKLAVEIRGGRAMPVPLKNFKYSLDALKQKITPKTKLIFIDNPVNPTGTWVTEKEVKTFFDGLSPEVIVVFDEAYNEFVEAEEFPNSIEYLEDKPIVIVRTFSKAHGLSGLRVGYGISNPTFVSFMNRVRQPFNVNSLAQVGALASLEDATHIERTKSLIRREKLRLYEHFDTMKLFYIPSAANFILVDVKRDGSEIFQEMLKQGVIVRNMKAYGLNNFLRITIGTAQENKKCIKALQKVLG